MLPHAWDEDDLNITLDNLQELGFTAPPDEDADPAQYLDEEVILTPAGQTTTEHIRRTQEGERERIEFELSSGETYTIVRGED